MPPSNPQTTPQPSTLPHTHKKQALIFSAFIILIVLIAGILLYRYNKLHPKDQTEKNLKMLYNTIPEGNPDPADLESLQKSIPQGDPHVNGPTTPPPTDDSVFLNLQGTIKP